MLNDDAARAQTAHMGVSAQSCDQHSVLAGCDGEAAQVVLAGDAVQSE